MVEKRVQEFVQCCEFVRHGGDTGFVSSYAFLFRYIGIRYQNGRFELDRYDQKCVFDWDHFLSQAGAGVRFYVFFFSKGPKLFEADLGFSKHQKLKTEPKTLGKSEYFDFQTP